MLLLPDAPAPGSKVLVHLPQGVLTTDEQTHKNKPTGSTKRPDEIGSGHKRIKLWCDQQQQ
jgi:hypothetical protein